VNESLAGRTPTLSGRGSRPDMHQLGRLSSQGAHFHESVANDSDPEGPPSS
jgi:hypothetical protein